MWRACWIHLFLSKGFTHTFLDELVNDFTTRRRTMCFCQHLHWHFPRTKASHSNRRTDRRQAFFNRLLNIRIFHSDGHLATEFADIFYSYLHSLTSSTGIKRIVGVWAPTIIKIWYERRDSNSHRLPHWNLNPARLPIPPLSQFVSDRHAYLIRSAIIAR